MAVPTVIGAAFMPLTSHLFAADDPKLTAPAVDPAVARDEDALRLVNRDTPEARQQIKAILQNDNSPAAQIAVAQALSQSPAPDSQLIPLLARLLGPNPSLTDVAANALANYRQNAEAFDQLRRFVNNPANPNLSRIKVVHAIGNIVDPDKPQANYLINLLGQSGQNGGIKDAATLALADLTGITDFGKDIRKWQQWWTLHQGDTPEQFQAMLLGNRVAQFNLLRQRDAKLAASVRDRLRAIYLAAPVAARDAIVLGYLNDPSPDVRIDAVELVDGSAIRNLKIAPAIIAQLTSMIADSDSVVRVSVAALLGNLPGIDDQTIVGPLLDQLAVEKNAAVKQAIATDLGKLKNPQVISRAVPALIAMLKDNQSDDLHAAADAFANLGEKLRSSDAVKADQVSGILRGILASTPIQPGTDALRKDCMHALAALRDPKSFDTFINTFNGNPETAEVREAALDGLGNLSDTRADQVVADQLNDNDPAIRLKAAAALRTVATQGFDQAIFQKMTSNDTEPETRAYLWQAMQHLFDQEGPAQLKRWATQFDRDPEKKLITLQKLGSALQKAGQTDEAAENEQAIADATMADIQPGETKPTAAQIADAIKHATTALNYWRQPGKAAPGLDERLETLIGQIMDYKLQSANWQDAADFAAAQLSINPKYTEFVGPRIRDKIDSLANKESRPADAQKLIDAALAMKPALDAPVLNDIRQIQTELKQAPQQ